MSLMVPRHKIELMALILCYDSYFQALSNEFSMEELKFIKY